MFSSSSLELVFARAFALLKSNFLRIIGLGLLTFIVFVGIMLALGLLGALIYFLFHSTIFIFIKYSLIFLLGACALIIYFASLSAFAFSWYKILTKMTDGEKVEIKDLWFGFSYKKKSIFLVFGMFFKTFPWFSIVPAVAAFVFAARTSLPSNEFTTLGIILVGVTLFLLALEVIWRQARYNLLPFLAVNNVEENILPLAKKSDELMNGAKWYYVAMYVILFCTSLCISLPFAFIPESSNWTMLYWLFFIPFSIFSWLCSVCFYAVLVKKEMKEAIEK